MDPWLYVKPEDFMLYANIAITLSTGIGVAIGIAAHKFYRKLLYRRGKTSDQAFNKIAYELNEYGYSVSKRV
jgi:hypothetical protein